MTASGFGAADRVARAGDSMTGPLTMSAAPVNYVEATSTSTAVNIQATGDTQQRLIVDASGTHTWGTGAAVGDVNLSRSAVGVLACNGIWQAATVQGGSGSAGTLTLTSTSNATKGKILLGAASAFDEVNTRLGIGTASPGVAVDVVGQITASAIMQAPVQQGGVGSGGNITIASTTHATKGKILIGTSAYDETNNRLGIGKNNPAVPLDVVGAAATTGNVTVGGDLLLSGGATIYRNKLSSATTVANTITETVIAVLTIPANDAVVGAVYRIYAWGIASVTGTPTMTWRTRIGGVAGGSMAQSGARTASTGITNHTWSVLCQMVCVSTGVGGAWFCQLQAAETLSVAGAGQLTPVFVQDGTASRVQDTTISNDFVITALWSAASASNTLTCNGYMAERVA